MAELDQALTQAKADLTFLARTSRANEEMHSD